MGKNPRFGNDDWACLAIVVMISGSAIIFRQFAIVPVDTVGLCAAAHAPGFCAPRTAVLWLQYQKLFGWAALLLGVTAFISGRRLLSALGLGMGIAAVVNYNGTMGILGAALGLLAWAGVSTGRYETPG